MVDVVVDVVVVVTVGGGVVKMLGVKGLIGSGVIVVRGEVGGGVAVV